MRKAVNEVCSAGLTMTELPAASAGAIFQASISNGKFHGNTAATTPTGSRTIIAIAPLLVIVALLCGLVWGALRVWTHGLLAPLIAHLTWDLLVFVLFPVE